MEQDLYWNLQVNFSCFFAFFTGLFDEIVFILLWFERFLPLHKYYKVKTDDVTSGTRDVGFRGKWINNSFNVMGNWVQVLVLYKWDQTTDPGQKEHTKGQFNKIFASVIHRLKHKLLSKRQL